MSKVQTDNSYFEIKVKLRQAHLPAGPVRVLDCFAGGGRIWDEIKRRHPKRDIRVLRIDRKPSAGGVYLAGDNRKYMQSLDMNAFDVIDLDAYGVPYEQLKILFQNKFTRPKTVFVTFIQTLFGQLPKGFLAECGYSKKMVDKCPTLFNKNGIDKLKCYPAKMGVKRIARYSDQANRKHYLCFVLNERQVENESNL